jgi:hypothetical protein
MRFKEKTMDPRLFFRKLWHPDMVARWNAGELTSVHHHGEPPEWIPLRQQGIVNLNQYPLSTHVAHGVAHGTALPSAVERYVQICVQGATPWAAVPQLDKWVILEQAGVFAFPDPIHAYWYAGAATPNDVFVVFYGVEVSPGPEPTSVVTPVIKKVAFLTLQEFVDQYLHGVAPL